MTEFTGSVLLLYLPRLKEFEDKINGEFQGAGALNTIPAGTGQPQKSHCVPERVVPMR